MRNSQDNLTGIAIIHRYDDHTGSLSFYPRLKGKPPVFGYPFIRDKSDQIKPEQPVLISGNPYLDRQYVAPSFHPLNQVSKLDDNMSFFTNIPHTQGSFISEHFLQSRWNRICFFR